MEQRQSGARREPGPMPPPAGIDQILKVIEQFWRSVDLPDARLNFRERRAIHDGLQFEQHLTAIQTQEHFPLGRAVRDAEFDAHQKPVKLGFRQGKRADLVLRILGGHDEEWRGKRVRHSIHRDVRFLHRFQQGALRFGRRPVDLVDQHHLGKKRPGVKHEALLFAVENGIADDVRGQEVAGELDAPEIEPQGAGQRVGERGLADAGQIFDQQVASGHYAGDGQADRIFLADDDLADLRDQRLYPGIHSDSLFCRVGKLSSAHAGAAWKSPDIGVCSLVTRA